MNTHLYNEFSTDSLSTKEARLCYGQRHQIFVQAPKTVSKECEGYKDAKKPASLMTAWHNQWLYGTRPLAMVKRFAEYCKSDNHYKWTRTNTGMPLDQFKYVAEAIMSLDIENGTCDKVYDESKNIGHDFTLGDNNDGVTIIQIPEPDTNSPKKLKYAFITGSDLYGGITGKAWNAKDEEIAVPKGKYKISTAREYLYSYYHKDPLQDTSHTEEFKSSPAYKELRETGEAVADYLEANAELLTLEEVRALFPKMTIDLPM